MVHPTMSSRWCGFRIKALTSSWSWPMQNPNPLAWFGTSQVWASESKLMILLHCDKSGSHPGNLRLEYDQLECFGDSPDKTSSLAGWS